MNVGTMTATAAADPALSLPASGGSGGVRDAGGFAAVLRDASGTTGGSAGDSTGGGAVATETAEARSSTAAETDDGDPTGETGDAAEAAAAQLLVAWQRSTTTGLAVTPTAAPGDAATATAGLPVGEAAVLPTAALPSDGALVHQGDAAAAVLPETDGSTDGPVLDLTGMEAVPETPLELGDPGADDPDASTSGDGQASHHASQETARATALASATASTAPASGSAGPPTAAAAATSAIEVPAAEAPAVEPAVSAAPTAAPATARADALAAPTATIRADELQRAIADTARQLADQGGGRHRISVRITSPDLGQVVIEIVSRGSEVRVTLQPQDTGAGGSLQQQQQAVARALASEGFTLSGFDVQTGHPDGRGREDTPQPQGDRAIDDEFDRIDLTATDDGALRL